MESGIDLQDILGKAREGDRSAFDRLAGLFRSDMETWIRYQIGGELASRVEVQDLLQETYLEAFQDLRRFQRPSEEGFRHWLAAIARHVVLSHLRRWRAKKRAAVREIPLAVDRGSDGPSTERAQDPRPTPGCSLRREERFGRLQEALNRLSPDHREVIGLALLNGLPLQEVARRMNRSPNAISMLLVRARRSLRKEFSTTGSLSLPTDRSLNA